MKQSDIKKILEAFKKNGGNNTDQAAFIRLMMNHENENDIKDFLMHELANIQVPESSVKTINFRKIFNLIRHQIERNQEFVKSYSILSNPVIRRILQMAAVFITSLFAGGVITYFFMSDEKPVSATFSEVSTPLASTSKIILADGTEVILNAGSKINYNNSFNLKDRKLYLQGEAYFKVAANRELPFIVITSHLNIVAVGTEFNVKAYAEEKTIVATLIKGRAQVLEKGNSRKTSARVMLEPNQKAVFIKDQNNLTVETTREVEEIINTIPAPRNDTVYVFKEIDTRPSVVWTENKMIISKESMASLAIKLERKYDVIIRFENEEVKNFRFTGTLLDETIQQVLNAISLSAPINYTMEGKTITIFENRKMKEKFKQQMKPRP